MDNFGFYTVSLPCNARSTLLFMFIWPLVFSILSAPLPFLLLVNSLLFFSVTYRPGISRFQRLWPTVHNNYILYLSFEKNSSRPTRNVRQGTTWWCLACAPPSYNTVTNYWIYFPLILTVSMSSAIHHFSSGTKHCVCFEKLLHSSRKLPWQGILILFFHPSLFATKLQVTLVTHESIREICRDIQCCYSRDIAFIICSFWIYISINILRKHQK